jgi:hypothetical protein
MSPYSQLKTDYDIALSDAALLARAHLSVTIDYLTRAQNYSVTDIHNLLAECLVDLNVPTAESPRLAVVAGTHYKR